MENLVNLTINNTLAIGLLLFFLIIAIIIILYITQKFLKLIKVKSIRTKFGTAEFISEREEDKEEKIENKIEVNNFLEHNYFHLLERVSGLGTLFECSSHIKSYFINELLKVYSKAIQNVLIPWIISVSENKGEGLNKITEVISNIDTLYKKDAKNVDFKIYVNDKEYRITCLPDFLLRKFKIRHDPDQRVLTDQLLDILTDKFHPSWESKLVAMLDVMECLYRTSFVSLDNISKSLNGELDEYLKNYINNDCKR